VLAGAGLAFGVVLVEVELAGDGVAAPVEPAGDDAVLLAAAEPPWDGALLLDEVERAGDGAPLADEVDPDGGGAAELLEPVKDGAALLDEGGAPLLVAPGPLAADVLPPVPVEPA